MSYKSDFYNSHQVNDSKNLFVGGLQILSIPRNARTP